MRYGALVVNDLLYPIYGNRPGRLARIIGKSGEADQVLIGQPFVKGPNGRPQPLQEGQAPPPQQEAKSYKLTPDADFNVAVKITKNYDTQREKGAAMLGEIIGSDPVMMTWFGDLFFKNTDIPGHDELAERAKLMLAPPIQQSLNQPEDQKIPPQVQQEMAKMAEVLKATTAELQQKRSRRKPTRTASSSVRKARLAVSRSVS
jgi:hypothetical protein